MTAPFHIPFNRPGFEGNELNYISEAIERSKISGHGFFTERCEQFLQNELGVPRVLLTTSCTHALEMAALLLDIATGDEVIVPSYTFVSTANAFVTHGAIPVFVDIRSDTLNLDEDRVEAAITARTKAIVVVHYAGVACEMDRILEIGERYGIAIIEDNAHGLFGTYKDRALGSMGTMATQSFHETKNVICGEGGALIINDPALIDRAEVLREKGTNRRRFFRGQVDKYSWVDIGSSYLPSDILAAFLYAQLESIQSIQARRQALWQRYFDDLSEHVPRSNFRLPVVPPECGQAYHMFYLILPSLEQRQALIEHLRAVDIQAVFHYLPLHLSDVGRKYNDGRTHCPVAESVSNRIVRLPFFTNMTQSEQGYVLSNVTKFLQA